MKQEIVGEDILI